MLTISKLSIYNYFEEKVMVLKNILKANFSPQVTHLANVSQTQVYSVRDAMSAPCVPQMQRQHSVIMTGYELLGNDNTA